jgi:CDP-glucose 4,6-dehydratase
MEHDFWKGKKVLVTGANGFVGSNLVTELLRRQAEVFAFVADSDHENPLFSEIKSRLAGVMIGDVADYHAVNAAFSDNGIEICFHLAAQALVGDAFESPLPTFRTNILGTTNVLEAARCSKDFKSLVIASTTHVYGDNKELPYLETFFPRPSRPYETSKACADILAQTYYYTYNLPVAIARFTNTYGPGDLNFSRVVPKAMQSVVNGKNPEIIGGTAVRDYLYIKDAVDAYMMLAENVEREEIKGQAFNFGSERLLSVIGMTEKVIDVSGKKDLDVIVHSAESRSKEIDKQYVSVEKARNLLGWEARYGVEEALRETYAWYNTVV